MIRPSSRPDDTAEIAPAGPTTPALSWQVAAASWVGMVRHNNQDSAFTSSRLIGVADGMGGEAAGDLASMVAARRLWIADADGADPVQALAQAVKAADSDIAALVMGDPSLAGMGTTICAAMLAGSELAFVHIGDSRAYRWRAGRLTQLTHDHSFVQQLIDQGQLTQDEARFHPKRSLVLRIVNGTPLSRPDQFKDWPLPGDRYLLCSDGLCGYVGHGAIEAALRQDDINQALDEMLAAADKAGAPDNVTIVLADIVNKRPDALAIPPRLWGAADAMTPPPQPVGGSIVEQLGAWGVSLDQGEQTVKLTPSGRPAEKRPARRRRRLLTRLVVWLVAAAVVLAGGAIGGQAWLRTQYFIGQVDGQAAIFQGVPYHVGPWYFSSIAQRSSVWLSDLPAYYADQVRDWSIKPTSLAAAEEALAQLKAKADACVAARLDPANAPAGQDCP